MMGLKLLLFFFLLAVAMVAAEAQSLAGCPNKCGHVDIPYPFGVGVQPGTSRNCFLEQRFNLTCHNSTLFWMNVEVSNISVQQGEMDFSSPVSKGCYSQSRGDPYQYFYFLGADAFTISSTRNKFVTLGCDALSLIVFQNSYRNYTYYGGCVALCDTPPPKEMDEKTCSGAGCCQVDIPDGINNITVEAGSIYNYTKLMNFKLNCSYAFVAKSDWFNFSSDYVHNFPYDWVPLVVDWTVSSDTCQNASAGCACKNNTYVERHDGYRYKCKCIKGFEGNPYHPDGCHDVNECSRPNKCSTDAQCHNFDGGYSCSCPPGYKGDGYVDGTRCTSDNGSNPNLRILIIALSSSVFLLVIFAVVSTSCWVHKRRTLKQLRQRNFEQNGGNMLQQRLSQQGYTDRTRIYTEVELENATNNFDETRILGRGGQGTVYKGILPNNTLVAIKKPRVAGDARQIKDFINEIFVLSQINHRNVVKLLGCCLETDVPLLVYEFVDNGTLLDHIDPSKNERSITWETRLTIAAETANAISYLHSATSIPIIHRDIKSSNILLDHNGGAKVSDFGASKLVPLDETQIATMVQGTLGYLDPEYLHTGQLNEKSDVYSFGVVLVELLTGNKATGFYGLELRNLAMYFVSSIKEDRLWEILDSRVLGQRKNAEQLKEVAFLARRCLRVNGEKRPTMKEVAIELDNMIAMEKHPWVKDKDMMVEESEYLLGHIPKGYEDAGASISMDGCDSTQKQVASEIADGR